jgi:hypothetical protein
MTLSRRPHKVATKNIGATLYPSCDFAFLMLLSSCGAPQEAEARNLKCATSEETE